MDWKDKSQYWMELADYDLETAKALMDSKRFLYVGFMCHQAVEKALKSQYARKLQATIPYSHNLKYLAEKSGIYNILSEEQKRTIDILNPLNIEARYPTYKEQLMQYLTQARCGEILKETQSLIQWIKQQL